MFLRETYEQSKDKREDWEDIVGQIGKLNRLMEGDTLVCLARLALQEVGEISYIEQIYLCQKDGGYAPTNVLLVHMNDNKIMGYDIRAQEILDLGNKENVLNYAIALQAIAYCGGMINKLELVLSKL